MRAEQQSGAESIELKQPPEQKQFACWRWANFPLWLKRTLAIVLIVGSYVGFYSVLSAFGKYQLRPSGEHRYASIGLARLDRWLWSPVGMYWERRKSVDGSYIVDADPIGWLFLPCIWFDRRYVHPTRTYGDELERLIQGYGL